MSIERKSRRAIRVMAIVATVVAAIGLSGCSNSGTDGDTFKIWWYSDPNQVEAQMWNAALDVFKEEHPDVEVEFQQKSFQQIRSNGAQILSSNEAPDVLQYNQGTGDTGFIAKNGLISNLSDYAEQYGWDMAIPQGGQFTAKYDDRGVMGSGAWYAVPNFPIYITVYYNKSQFEENGLAVPTTLDEFESDMQTFVDKGTTPLSLAGGEYPAWQLWYELALANADRSFVDDFILFKGNADFAGPEMTSGADTFEEWVDKGYISSQAASVKFDDASTGFVSGQYPIIVTGSWMFSSYLDQITGFDWGTFNFPGNTLYEGSGGNNWVVPTVSKNKDLAAEFIDITLRPEMQAMLGAKGLAPITGVTGDIDNPKIAEFIGQYNEISDDLAYWPDMSVPGYDPPMVNAFQSIINGSSTPAEALEAIKDPYEQGATDYK